MPSFPSTVPRCRDFLSDRWRRPVGQLKETEWRLSFKPPHHRRHPAFLFPWHSYLRSGGGRVTMFPQRLWSIPSELFNCINLSTWGATRLTRSSEPGPNRASQRRLRVFTPRRRVGFTWLWTRVGAEPWIRWQKWLRRNSLVTLPPPLGFSRTNLKDSRSPNIWNTLHKVVVAQGSGWRCLVAWWPSGEHRCLTSRTWLEVLAHT